MGIPKQAFSNDALGVSQIKEWCNRFKDGRMSAFRETVNEPKC
jgi:hypothetical protein